MANACLDNNLLKYGGTSQLQRKLNALAASSAQIDERTAADFILFAKNYAAYLNYYNTADNADGDWQVFMNNDPAVIIADVAEWRTKDFIPFIDGINTSLQAEADVATAQNLFKALFDFAFTLATNLNTNLTTLNNDITFKNYLSIAIASNLALPLNSLWQYYNDFKASSSNVINESADYVDPDMPVNNLIFSEHFNLNNLSSEWQIASFTAPAITLDAPDVIANINLIITHNLFTGALQSFINGVIKIVADAPFYLNDVLENYALHQPHYALYLTFVRLFQFAQKKLNNYTQEHLDFYYETVLQLKNAIAQPDFVHLLFDLQKNVSDHILTKGTAFKAGKDANNNNLYYTLTDDVVLHQATVQSLKSLYLNKNGASVLYASPVANSDDGNGAKLQSADKSWFVFGDVDKIKKATIGFAIASNILYLNEGGRTVNIIFQCNNNVDASIESAFNNQCNIQFTGKKNWFYADDFNTSNKVTCKFISANSFSLSVTIPGSAPPVVPYSSKIHGGSFTQALPMLQLQLTGYNGYTVIKQLEISSVNIIVNVFGVKDITLQNDDGKINIAKPFKLFGEFPEQSSSLIIGSKEIFQKQLTSLTLDFIWQPSSVAATSTQVKNYYSIAESGIENAQTGIQQFKEFSLAKSETSVISEESKQYYYTTINTASVNPAEIDYLSQGDWKTLGSTSKPISNLINSDSNITVNTATFQSINIAPAPADFTANEEYKTTSRDGFLKIQLNDNSFNLSTYLYNVRQSVAKTKVTTVTSGNTTTYTMDPPNDVQVPNSPAALSVKINYSASENFDLDDATNFLTRTDFFYHIEPFGFREMHAALLSNTNDKLTVLPVFNLDDGKSNDDGGELWIGLNNATAAETFSVLFQVADGTSDPLTPMTTVNWYYLSANNWKQFDKLDVTDATNNLTRSGIVIFNIPVDDSITTTRADNNLLWIKAVVDHDTDAVCKLIAITTNAAKATFLQDVSNNIVFTKALAPNTISKAAVADAAIKKINQPYTSFDGRISETDDQFYIRVSERLKHKQRAVTAWDYERLVLQNYPQIHKVKCINHTGLITDNSNNPLYSETLPGHVTVVTIPDLTNNTAANALRPYTSIGLLTEIQQYLETLNSPFVKLHVINPQFEEVQFDFSVVFMPNHDDTVFGNQLNTDIEQFLTPWAYSSNNDIEFGGTIEKSVVLNFIEERNYVDYVTCFKMNHIITRTGTTIQQALYDIEEAVATTARSILVSYNDGKNKHLIHPQPNCNC